MQPAKVSSLCWLCALLCISLSISCNVHLPALQVTSCAVGVLRKAFPVPIFSMCSTVFSSSGFIVSGATLRRLTHLELSLCKMSNKDLVLFLFVELSSFLHTFTEKVIFSLMCGFCSFVSSKCFLLWEYIWVLCLSHWSTWMDFVHHHAVFATVALQYGLRW